MSSKPSIRLKAKVEPVTISTELTEKLNTLLTQQTRVKSETTIPGIDVDSLGQPQIDACYRVVKKQISIRIDQDVLEWFQQQPGKYQQQINKACRVYMRLKQQTKKQKS